MTSPQLDSSRLEALLESAQLLHSSLDLEDLLKHLLRTVMGRLLVGRGLVAVRGDDGGMRLALVRGARALKAGDLFDETSARAAGVDLILPVGDAEAPVGLVGVSRPPHGEIASEEMESLKALLGIAANGIANANAHAESHRLNQSLAGKIHDLRTLLDLVRGLSSKLEPDAVASLLMLTLAGHWMVRKYLLAAWKDGHPLVLRQKGITLPDVESYKQIITELPEAVAVEDLPHGDFKEKLRDQGAALLFPVRVSEVTIGVVILGARPGNLRYSAADLEFGAGLVAQAGVAFENAWYVIETLERRKIEQELTLAASIQEGLFPERMPLLAGYDLAARNRPARQCGGDYYDALPVEDDAIRNGGSNGEEDKAGNRSFLLCVADVSGKGLPASLLMSNMQATLRALLGRTGTLAALAAETNELLHATTPSSKYVTAMLVELRLETGRLAYVNAGHEGGLLLRADDSYEWLQPTGTPIGMFAGLPYEEASLQLAHGDLLALFSDGVPEARNMGEDEFGGERLLAHLRRARHKPAQEIVHEIFEEIDTFAGAAPQHDDITLLVVKRAH